MRWIQPLNIFGENCKFRLTLTTTKFITKVYSHCWILAYGKVVLLSLRCAIFWKSDVRIMKMLHNIISILKWVFQIRLSNDFYTTSFNSLSDSFPKKDNVTGHGQT